VFTDRRTEGKKHHNISRRSLRSLGGYKKRTSPGIHFIEPLSLCNAAKNVPVTDLQ